MTSQAEASALLTCPDAARRRGAQDVRAEGFSINPGYLGVFAQHAMVKGEREIPGGLLPTNDLSGAVGPIHRSLDSLPGVPFRMTDNPRKSPALQNRLS